MLNKQKTKKKNGCQFLHEQGKKTLSSVFSKFLISFFSISYFLFPLIFLLKVLLCASDQDNKMYYRKFQIRMGKVS